MTLYFTVLLLYYKSNFANCKCSYNIHFKDKLYSIVVAAGLIEIYQNHSMVRATSKSQQLQFFLQDFFFFLQKQNNEVLLCCRDALTYNLVETQTNLCNKKKRIT